MSAVMVGLALLMAFLAGGLFTAFLVAVINLAAWTAKGQEEPRK